MDHNLANGRHSDYRRSGYGGDMKKDAVCILCYSKFTVDSESKKDQSTYWKRVLSKDGKQTILDLRPSTKEELEETMNGGVFLKCQECGKTGIPKFELFNEGKQ
jgi:hypothetical protein